MMVLGVMTFHGITAHTIEYGTIGIVSYQAHECM